MANVNGLSGWPKEEIPDDDYLYLRVHRNHQSHGELGFAAFRDRPPPPDQAGKSGMSTHWSRYATPESAQARAKSPENIGVVRMPVGGVRAIPRLSVEHTPLAEDRSHSDVLGPKDTESRLQLKRVCEWVVPTPPEN